MCGTQLAKNTGCKNSQSALHRTTLFDSIFETEACVDSRGKTC